jgi:hypothetical protein
MERLLCVALLRQLLLLLLTALIGLKRRASPAIRFHCEAADSNISDSVQSSLCVPVTEQKFTAFAAVQAAENVIFRLPRRYRGSGAKDSSRIGFRTAARAFGHEFASLVVKQASEDKSL